MAKRKEKKKGGCLGCLVYVLAFIGLCVLLLVGVSLYAAKQGETKKSGKKIAVQTEKQTGQNEQQEAAEEQEKTEQTQASDGVRSEIKDAIDGYEAFFYEYADFMEKLAASPNDASLLLASADYLTKYADYMEKFEAIEDEELNDAETQYFLEASVRIEARLVNAVGSM